MGRNGDDMKKEKWLINLEENIAHSYRIYRTIRKYNRIAEKTPKGQDYPLKYRKWRGKEYRILKDEWEGIKKSLRQTPPPGGYVYLIYCCQPLFGRVFASLINYFYTIAGWCSYKKRSFYNQFLRDTFGWRY